MRKPLLTVFYSATCIVLLFALIGKLLSLPNNPQGYASHAILPFLTVSQVARIGIGLDTITILTCLAKVADLTKMTVIMLLFSLFLCYHLAFSAVGVSYYCGCFGNLHTWFGADHELSRIIAVGYSLFAVACSSAYFIAEYRSVNKNTGFSL